MNQQARHILALINIPLWVGRHARTEQVHGQPDRFGALMPHADPAHDTTHATPANTDTAHASHTPTPAPTITDTERTAHHITAQQPHSNDTSDNYGKNNQSDKSEKTTKPHPISTNSDSRFRLQGVRIGGWVLVVDVYAMTGDEIQLWHGLSHALATHAHTHTPTPHRTHEITYPLVSDDYAEHQSLSAAQGVFVGFMLALGGSDGGADTSPKVAFLTAIPQGIKHHNDAVLPTLADMLANPALKKSLWATVVGA